MSKNNFIKELTDREYTKKLSYFEFVFKNDGNRITYPDGIVEMFSERGMASPDDIISIITLDDKKEKLEALNIEESSKMVNEIKNGLRKLRMNRLKTEIKSQEMWNKKSEDDLESEIENKKNILKCVKKQNKDETLKMKKDLIALEKEDEE